MITQFVCQMFKQMFSKEPVLTSGGIDFDLSYTVAGLARIIVYIPHSEGRMQITCIEQNHYTNSVYAKRAKAGASIMWVIAEMNSKEKWLGRVENGKWYSN